MRKVLGRYELLAPIASGGMATVHLARAVGVGGFERLVAIKVMHPDVARDSSFVAMFLDEARLAARVRHPNIVGTIDVQESPDGLFIVMEFVEGPSVSAILKGLGKKNQPLPLPMTLRIMIDALTGLHAAHEQTGPSGEPLNIVHRDISPQNILVGIDGHAKITDFGVASAEARLASTDDGSVKGKVAYMPPEQIRAEKVDRRADVYAAGIVLWEMLTRQRLFAAENPGAIIFAVMNGAQRSPRDVEPSIPEAVDRACMNALKMEIDGRYPTALAFAQALERAAQEAGVTIASAWDLGSYIKDLAVHLVPPKTEAAVVELATRAETVEKTSSIADATATLVKPSATPPQTSQPAQSGDSQITSVNTSSAVQPVRSNRTGLVVAGLAIALAGIFGVVQLLPANGDAPKDGTSREPEPSASALPVIGPIASATQSASTQPSTSAAPPIDTATKSAKSTGSAIRPTATTKTSAKSKDDWKPDGL